MATVYVAKGWSCGGALLRGKHITALDGFLIMEIVKDIDSPSKL
jgi:hypothetical protein